MILENMYFEIAFLFFLMKMLISGIPIDFYLLFCMQSSFSNIFFFTYMLPSQLTSECTQNSKESMV